jgi:hypothetical protein
MIYENRRSVLENIFSSVDGSQKELIKRLIDEVVFLEERMEELKKVPFLAIHPNNPMKQKLTPAAKLYKECSQSYMNAIRILIGVLKQTDMDEQDELLKRLNEFMAI